MGVCTRSQRLLLTFIGCEHKLKESDSSVHIPRTYWPCLMDGAVIAGNSPIGRWPFWLIRLVSLEVKLALMVRTSFLWTLMLCQPSSQPLNNRQYHFHGILIIDCRLVPLYNCILIICGSLLTLGAVTVSPPRSQGHIIRVRQWNMKHNMNNYNWSCWNISVVQMPPIQQMLLISFGHLYNRSCSLTLVICTAAAVDQLWSSAQQQLLISFGHLHSSSGWSTLVICTAAAVD